MKRVLGDYERILEDARLQWGRNSGETAQWARLALRALLSGELDELGLALTVYQKLKPVDARARPVLPRIKGGRLSVRNLENTSNPVEGAAAARRSLEAVLLIYEHRMRAPEEVAAFLKGEIRLFALYHALRQARASMRDHSRTDPSSTKPAS